MFWLSYGFIIKRKDYIQKDIYINLVDFSDKDQNIYKYLTQLEITETNQKRIPDGILYINGLPLMQIRDEFGYPPVDKNEVYQEIFTQAENYKKNRS
ncbi:type I restriction endonuclease [Tenacibaculum dicentrarchi]|nr:type I restriction endonuclease [Tenacibaculum dicentrarchi]